MTRLIAMASGHMRRSLWRLVGLAGRRLRSHGGLAKRPWLERANWRLRNFDIFDFAVNGVR